jgi:hypothetical protein
MILLFTSIVMMIGSNVSYGGSYFDWNSDPSPAEVSAYPNISRALERNDWFKVRIDPSQDWNDHLQPADSSVPAPYQPVFVNITDPNGEETEILVDFMLVNEKSALVLYNITVTESHGMSLIHFDPPLYGTTPGIVAKATETGNYTARIVAIMGGGSPPFTMVITKGKVVNEWVSYAYLLYPSIGLFLASAILVIYGFREKKTGHWRRPEQRAVTR